jgi:hypothetical protein
MRRLLILGVAAATALLSAAATTAPALASQHTKGPRIVSCTDIGSAYFSVTAKGTNFYLGVPNTINSTSVAMLKPAQNSTTHWTLCETATGTYQFILKQGGKWYALTSRSTAAGADVSLAAVTNNGTNGTAFMSQLWAAGGSNPYTFQNQLTLLYLRVRNNGPKMRQPVTTGLTSEPWTLST